MMMTYMTDGIDKKFFEEIRELTKNSDVHKLLLKQVKEQIIEAASKRTNQTVIKDFKYNSLIIKSLEDAGFQTFHNNGNLSVYWGNSKE